ncbi:hypothetical protein ACQ86N_11510 [Puia sp. P3]|uniref:hypothetical protein n=1 Tax=Puia sp. P3 TaxID=3423952 RepID=UPI003D677FFE
MQQYADQAIARQMPVLQRQLDSRTAIKKAKYGRTTPIYWKPPCAAANAGAPAKTPG